MPFIFSSCLIAPAKTILSKTGESGYFCLVLDLGGNVLSAIDYVFVMYNIDCVEL